MQHFKNGGVNNKSFYSHLFPYLYLKYFRLSQLNTIELEAITGSHSENVTDMGLYLLTIAGGCSLRKLVHSQTTFSIA